MFTGLVLQGTIGMEMYLLHSGVVICFCGPNAAAAPKVMKLCDGTYFGEVITPPLLANLPLVLVNLSLVGVNLPLVLVNLPLVGVKPPHETPRQELPQGGHNPL
jgi:hypothetical protein